MRTELDVVNACLATMGEVPLNSLSDPHTFKGAAQDKLTDMNQRIQATGWWFNRETQTLQPNVSDNYIYVPGDTLEIREATLDVAIRGDKLIKLDGGVFEFTTAVTVTLIRLVPFEDLPHKVQAYIEARAVHAFQTTYDGDTAKTRDLAAQVQDAWYELSAESTRQAKANMINSNVGLQRIKTLVRRNRAPYV